jgi:hypothetical protein
VLSLGDGRGSTRHGPAIQRNTRNMQQKKTRQLRSPRRHAYYKRTLVVAASVPNGSSLLGATRNCNPQLQPATATNLRPATCDLVGSMWTSTVCVSKTKETLHPSSLFTLRPDHHHHHLHQTVLAHSLSCANVFHLPRRSRFLRLQTSS